MKTLIVLLTCLMIMCCTRDQVEIGTTYRMNVDNGYAILQWGEGLDFTLLEYAWLNDNVWPSISKTEFTAVCGKKGRNYDSTVYLATPTVLHSTVVATPSAWEKTATFAYWHDGYTDSLEMRGRWDADLIKWTMLGTDNRMPDVDSMRASYGMWDGTNAVGDYVYPSGSDTTWWSFHDQKVFMAEKVKIHNADGFLPVKYYVGEHCAIRCNLKLGCNEISWNTYVVTHNYTYEWVGADTVYTTNLYDEQKLIEVCFYDAYWNGNANDYNVVPSVLWRGQYQILQMDDQGLQLDDVAWDRTDHVDVTMKPWHQSLLNSKHNAYRE